MNELAQFCRNLKKDFKPRSKDTKKPVSFWSEKDVLDGQIVDTFVIIFRTKGCSWALNSGCSMCGYFNDSAWKNVSDNDLLAQFDTAMNNYSGQKYVKIFTSGSFLDAKEVKPKVRKEILGKLVETTDKISVESRPEYISRAKLEAMQNFLKNKYIEVAIGLETVNDKIRNQYINKGLLYEDFLKAVQICKELKFGIRVYLLFKPPFLNEYAAIDDCLNSIEKLID